MVRLLGNYTVTQEDVDAGAPLEFNSELTGTNTNGLDLIPSTAVTHLTVAFAADEGSNSALQLTQTVQIEAAPAGPENRSMDIALEGDELVYTFRLKNNGHDTLYGVDIDTPVDIEELSGEGIRLDPGQTRTFYSSPRPVTASDVAAGSVENTAIASGQDSAEQPVASNPTTVSTPTSGTPVIIDTGSGAGESNESMMWIAGGGGLLTVSLALMLLAWDRGRRREKQDRQLAWA